MKIKEFERHRGGLQILYFLYHNNEGIISDFVYNLRIATNCINRTMEMLKRLRLVKEYHIKGHNKRIFRLTEKGKKMAKLIDEMEKIL